MKVRHAATVFWEDAPRYLKDCTSSQLYSIWISAVLDSMVLNVILFWSMLISIPCTHALAADLLVRLCHFCCPLLDWSHWQSGGYWVPSLRRRWRYNGPGVYHMWFSSGSTKVLQVKRAYPLTSRRTSFIQHLASSYETCLQNIPKPHVQYYIQYYIKVMVEILAMLQVLFD